MTAVVAAALAVGVWAWFVAGTFVLLAVDGRPLEYVFVGAPYWLLPAAAAAAAAVLIPLARRRGSGAFARPLMALALAPLAAIALLPGVAPRASVLLYLLVDLRPWWTGGILVAVLLRLGLRPAVPRSARVGVALLFAWLAAWAIWTTPHLRFDSALHGDEPKYLRFCENWYQGNGLEVSHVQTMAELGSEFSPPLWRNASLFAAAVRQDLALAASDLRLLVNERFSARFNRAEAAQAWIVRGRNGGYYQVHNPGLSALLFPAYFIDRHFLASSARYQGVFPDPLYLTNAAILCVWAGWGVAVFALLRAVTGSAQASWVLAAAGMMTMPVAAFGFQIYPEAAAGTIVCAVLAWTLTSARTDRRLWPAIAAGAAAGFLPWLHVRLLPLSLVLAVWAARRASRKRPLMLVYAAFLAALCAYAYHITGSLRPDAMYAGEGAEAAWLLSEAAQSAISMPFDRIWGFFPHAPVYLLALPGWVLLARRSRGLAAGLLLLIATLALPVAGHGFTAAGATPLRQLASVIPLLLIPLWEFLSVLGRARAVIVAVTVLAILSLDTAMSYNLNHLKHVGRHVDAGFSGWAPNLLFPWTHGELWTSHRGTVVLFAAWLVGSAVLLALPLLLRSAGRRPGTARLTAAAVVSFLVIASAATSLGGEMTRTDYFLPSDRAQELAIVAAIEQDRCRLCVSSLRGTVGRSDIIFAADHRLAVEGVSEPALAGQPIRIRLHAASEQGTGWGTIAADFGDGTSARMPIVGRASLVHRYATAGTYRVIIRFDPATGAPTQQSLELTVR